MRNVALVQNTKNVKSLWVYRIVLLLSDDGGLSAAAVAKSAAAWVYESCEL
jgi:hypothetical protein